MTVTIKKGESSETSLKKLEILQKSSIRKKNRRSSKVKEKSFQELCGSLKGFFKEDALLLQKKWRSEWEKS